MRSATILFPLALLASQVLADGAAIIAAIGNISNATVALNTTVASFPDSTFLDLLYVLRSFSSQRYDLDGMREATANLLSVQSALFSLTHKLSSTISMREPPLPPIPQISLLRKPLQWPAQQQS
jgi:hypothetical protein